MIKFLSNKWLSLFCTVINSTYASIAWDQGEYMISFLCFGFAFWCGHNFLIGIKGDYYDKDRK